MTTCCVGVPSGYIEPDGTVARMCDDECRCWVCVSQRPAALADRGAALDKARRDGAEEAEGVWPERWDHCYEDMGSDPCGKKPVGARRDPEDGSLYPVCRKHLRP